MSPCHRPGAVDEWADACTISGMPSQPMRIATRRWNVRRSAVLLGACAAVAVFILTACGSPPERSAQEAAASPATAFPPCEAMTLDAPLRQNHLTLRNWLYVDIWTTRVDRTDDNYAYQDGATPPNGTRRVCNYLEGLWPSPLDLDLDAGFGAPAPRRCPSCRYEAIDMTNLWVGQPSISIRIEDKNSGERFLAGQLGEHQGLAMAWGGRYFYVIRQPDDSCGVFRKCWDLTVSEIPDGVEIGKRYQWTEKTSAGEGSGGQGEPSDTPPEPIQH